VRTAAVIYSHALYGLGDALDEFVQEQQMISAVSHARKNICVRPTSDKRA